jgi:hypothetical protein
VTIGVPSASADEWSGDGANSTVRGLSMVCAATIAAGRMPIATTIAVQKVKVRRELADDRAGGRSSGNVTSGT